MFPYGIRLFTHNRFTGQGGTSWPQLQREICSRNCAFHPPVADWQSCINTLSCGANRMTGNARWQVVQGVQGCSKTSGIWTEKRFSIRAVPLQSRDQGVTGALECIEGARVSAPLELPPVTDLHSCKKRQGHWAVGQTGWWVCKTARTKVSDCRKVLGRGQTCSSAPALCKCERSSQELKVSQERAGVKGGSVCSVGRHQGEAQQGQFMSRGWARSVTTLSLEVVR